MLFVADSPGRAERTVEILQEYEIVAVPVEHAEDVHAATVLVAVGSLSRGFRLAEGALQLYAETDVFEEERPPAEKRRNLAKAFLSDLRDLKVGDLIVHVDHGIGEFVGLKQLGTVSRPIAGSAADVQEFLEIRYAGDDKLFVHVERLDLIQKYTGGTRPALDRLVGSRLLVGNIELRFPLLRPFGASQRMYGPVPVEVALFADGGVAWNRGQKPGLVGGSRNGIGSAGVAFRVNLLGYAVGQFDFARPFQRPGRGWLFQFNLSPGF